MFTKFHTAFSVTVGCDGELFTVLKTYLKIDKKIFNKLKTQLPVSGHCSRGLPVLQKKVNSNQSVLYMGYEYKWNAR